MVKHIADQCTQVDTGARNIDHILRATLLPQMSVAILERIAGAGLPKKVAPRRRRREELHHRVRGLTRASLAPAGPISRRRRGGGRSRGSRPRKLGLSPVPNTNGHASPAQAPPPAQMLVALALAGLGAGGLGAVALTGCAPVPPQAPKPCDVQVVTLNIYAADNINPNERGNPRPVVVRLYQLKNDVRMENATYDEILLKDKDTLAGRPRQGRRGRGLPQRSRAGEVRARSRRRSSLAGVALFHGPKGHELEDVLRLPADPGRGASCGAARQGRRRGRPRPTPRRRSSSSRPRSTTARSSTSRCSRTPTRSGRSTCPRSRASPEGRPPPAAAGTPGDGSPRRLRARYRRRARQALATLAARSPGQRRRNFW